MPALNTLTGQVASLLDVAVGASTTPSTSEVENWLIEGTIKLINMIPDDQLMKLSTRQDDDWSPMNVSGAQKIISVHRGQAQCTQVPWSQFVSLAEKYPYRYSSVSYAWAIGPSATGVGTDKPSIHIYPNDGTDFYAIYIPSITSSTDVPENLAGLVVEYAVIQGKIQDEEPEQANMLMQAWYQNVQIAAGGQPINKDGAL